MRRKRFDETDDAYLAEVRAEQWRRWKPVLLSVIVGAILVLVFVR